MKELIPVETIKRKFKVVVIPKEECNSYEEKRFRFCLNLMIGEVLNLDAYARIYYDVDKLLKHIQVQTMAPIPEKERTNFRFAIQDDTVFIYRNQPEDMNTLLFSVKIVCES